MSRNVFINYRRGEASGAAGRLYDRLTMEMPRNSVFMDVDAMKPGVDFTKQLDERVADCAILLALIGPHWLDATGAAGERRLSDESDPVRTEIASALRRGIPVVPVLLDGATLPREDELPQDLQPLVKRHAVELRHSRFSDDVQAIIRAVTEAMPHVRRRAQSRALVLGGLLLAATFAGAAVGILGWGERGGVAPKDKAGAEKATVESGASGSSHSDKLAAQRDGDASAWQAALDINTLYGYRAYVGAHPDGKWRREADSRIDVLAEEADWAAISSASNAGNLTAFLEQHPGGAHADEAQARLAKLSPASMLIRRIENRELEGENYAKLRQVTFDACAAHCAADQRCRAIEYYHQNQSCGLFDRVPLQAPKAAIDVGIKASMKTISVTGPPPAVTKLKILKRRSAPGEGFDTTFDSDYASCEARCLTSSRCQMIELYKPEAKCNLYDQRNTEANLEDDTIVAVR